MRKLLLCLRAIFAICLHGATGIHAENPETYNFCLVESYTLNN
jgi:hypothetical protein